MLSVIISSYYTRALDSIGALGRITDVFIPVVSRHIYTTIIDLSATQNITTMRREQMRNLIICLCCK